MLYFLPYLLRAFFIVSFVLWLAVFLVTIFFAFIYLIIYHHDHLLVDKLYHYHHRSFISVFLALLSRFTKMFLLYFCLSFGIIYSWPLFCPISLKNGQPCLVVVVHLQRCSPKPGRPCALNQPCLHTCIPNSFIFIF